MSPTRKLLRQARAHARWLTAAVLALALLAGMAVLGQRAAQEVEARRNPQARAFEASPDDWLRHETNASAFFQAVAEGRVRTAGLAQDPPGLVLYTLADGTRASTSVPGCAQAACAAMLLERLTARNATAGAAGAAPTVLSVHVDLRTASQRWLDRLNAVLSPLLLFGLLVGALVAATKLQTGLGSNSAGLAERPDTRFDDVVGTDEAKAALQRVRAFMHDPARYVRLGATPPRGVLLVGPPGTGKTLLAKALAGECQARFIAVDGSYFSAMYYGAGITKVRKLFKLARRHAPCVLFIDEIDGLGKRHQGGAPSGGESELNRIINRVLVEMDGFDAMANVVVVGATNHEDNIDVAMRRPGRFDMVVRLGLPTLPDRQRLFELGIAKLAHDGTADTAALARMSSGMSPADIANVVNKAASAAAEGGADRVAAGHLLRAIETQQLGGEVSPLKALLRDGTRRSLAYHEAGHALVGHGLRVGRVERVTIEPRGVALGVTCIHPETEEPLFSKTELTARLAMLLAGREAEALVFGNFSTGAADDLKRASALAFEMVGSLGFSEAFGLLSVAGMPKELLGPDVQAAVLKEARTLLEEAQASCRQVLTTRRAQLDTLAMALLEREVVSGDELARLLAMPALGRGEPAGVVRETEAPAFA